MKTRKIKTSKEIGELIKRRRRELGISQEMLAEILGVTYQQIQRYENGTNKLNIENIQKIAESLDITMPYFFKTATACAIEEKTPVPAIDRYENELLMYFRKIKDRPLKNMLIKMARLAARVQ